MPIGPAARTTDRDLKIDAVDLEIIQHLSRDGRMPYREIGEGVELSEAAVRQRVNRLRDDGVLEIVGVVNPLAVAGGESATIGIVTDGEVRSAARALSEIPQVGYVVITAGSFDLFAEVQCADRVELLDVSSEIRRLPHVLRSETFMILEYDKLVYNQFLPHAVPLGVRAPVPLPRRPTR